MMKKLRMRRLIRNAHMPIPEFRIHLGSGPQPGYDGQTYYDDIANTVFWVGPLSSRDDEFDFLHECGHAFDNHHLTNEDRAQATLLLTAHPRAWWWDRSPFQATARPDPVCELFADAFADMCRSPRRRARLRTLCLEAAR